MTSFLPPSRLCLAALAIILFAGCDTPTPSDPAPIASSNALGTKQSMAAGATGQAAGGSTGASAPTVSTGR